MTQEIIQLPQELKEFENLLKNHVQELGSSKNCITLMRCISTEDKAAWEEIQNQDDYKNWFAVEIDLHNINSQELFEKVRQEAKNFTQNFNTLSPAALQTSESISHCLVEANEKHFLFFGKEN